MNQRASSSGSLVERSGAVPTPFRDILYSVLRIRELIPHINQQPLSITVVIGQAPPSSTKGTLGSRLTETDARDRRRIPPQHIGWSL